VIVVDTNVISYLLIRGDRSEAMDRLLEIDGEWIAPRLWLDEFLNVLATYERNGMLASDEASPILNDALGLMQDSSYEVPPERVLAVARRTGCSAYDSQYVALAEDLGLKLYTCDQRVLKNCPSLAVEPK
jgi:predicted nucleic acid-binding protein